MMAFALDRGYSDPPLRCDEERQTFKQQLDEGTVR